MQQNSRESCQRERHRPSRRRETETEIKLPEVNAEVLRQFMQQISRESCQRERHRPRKRRGRQRLSYLK